ncbi:MAG: MATE family efflux transporter [Lachnospiraceae bacterium]|nr:MATE family efflux transporter [Lachnospiraceae bacterium]MBQ4372750.1 MATE family efflux transporter [Lachnospiraceae bacterium]
MNKQNQITEGTIWKQILLFFFPILLGSFFQQFYNTMDAIIVGRFAGKEALSCIAGSSAQISNFFVGFFSGLSVGVTVIIAQYYGARDEKRIDQALHTAYAFSLLFGLIGGGLCAVLCPIFLRWMQTPQAIFGGSVTYLRIYFGGMVFLLVYNMGSGILRAIGDSKRPLYFLMIGTLTNVVLDLFFVGKLHLGVQGAAIATFISQAISAVLVTWTLMYRVDGMQLVFRKLRLDRHMLRRIMRIGLPSAIETSTYSVSNIVLQSAMNRMGVDVVAAWAALGRIDGLQWMINGAFGMSITTFAGQNYGAGKMDRVRKGTWITLAMGAVTSMVFGVLLMNFGAPVFAIFTPDAKVIEIGMQMACIMGPFYWIFSFIEAFSGSRRAQNDVLVPTVICLVGICAVRIGWVAVLGAKATVASLVWCYPTTWIAGGILMTIYYLYRTYGKSAHGVNR